MALTGGEIALFAGGNLLNYFGGREAVNNAAYASYGNTILGQDQLRAQIAMGGLNANASARNLEAQALLGREALQNANTQAGIDRQFAYFLGPTKQYELQARAREKELLQFRPIERGQKAADIMSFQSLMNSPEQKAFEKRQMQNRIKEGLAGKFANFAPMLGAINMQPALNAFRGFS
jgi:hypothetical protein